MVCSPTPNFVGLDIAFMYSKMMLEISSRTNILSKAFYTGYQIDNVITITMKDNSCIISSIVDTACEIIGTYQIIFSNVTFAATSDRIGSNDIFVGV